MERQTASDFTEVPSEINCDETGLFQRKCHLCICIVKEEVTVPGFKADRDKLNTLGLYTARDCKLRLHMVYSAEYPGD